MPKIADLESTPNPNARKFVLKEPLTYGVARSFESADQANDDPLASKLFAVPHVTNVFYVD
ncbi:MAG: NifU N-terminal domain-containing protein, partial [Burkholderiales bacterium]